MSDYNRIISFPGVERSVSLADHSWFRTGGNADFFYKVYDYKKLIELLNLSKKAELPVFFLVGGSNLLFSDNGFRGLVIKNRLEKIKFKDRKLKVESGADLQNLIRSTTSRGIGGWEKLYGIPGTLGGAIRGNAGAYGTEISDFITKVTFINDSGKIEEKDKSSLQFSYRHSEFKDKKLFILSAEIELSKLEPDKSRDEIVRISETRKAKHPTRRTAGCFFKNPVPGEISAGSLIEEAGLKGSKIGDASISDLHCNFIVNNGNARSEDILNLAGKIKREVKAKTGIELKEEIEIVPESY